MGISGPSLEAYVDTNREYKGDTFLWLGSWTSPPHSLSFYSKERSGEVTECVITDLTVRYAHEETLHRPANLPAVAQYERKATYADGSDVYYSAKFEFEDLIEREESFTLGVEGYYQMRDGTRRPFQSEEYLEVSRDPQVRPIAVVWAGV